jgi:hypothetical protein
MHTRCVTDTVTKEMPTEKISIVDHNTGETSLTTTHEIMLSAAFVAGVDDVRNGCAPDYDQYCFSQDEDEDVAMARIDALWNYERGRQWGRLAPPSMPLKINGRRLNPKAVALFNLAYERKLII